MPGPPALLESPAHAHARLPSRRHQAVLPRARGAGARALARARRLRPLARQPRGGRGLELLRGPADRQRPPRLPPRPLPGLQGRLPPLPDDERLPGAAQGGLGLPRAAGRDRGRKRARDRFEAGDRGVRDRQVQRPLPGVGLRVRRGVEPPDRADRLLDRPRRPLPHPRRHLHRVGLVVAAPALGRAAPLRGAQGRPLLPALRHGALLARGGARLPGRSGPVHIREIPAHPRGRRDDRRVAAGLDDDALDAARQRGGRRRPRRRLREGPGRGRDPDPRRGAGREGARRGGRDRRAVERRRPGRPPVRGTGLRARRPRRRRLPGPRRRLRHHRGRHRPRPHSSGVRRGRLRGRRRQRHLRPDRPRQPLQPGRPRRQVRPAGGGLRGAASSRTPR